jgi:hypothetical protein
MLVGGQIAPICTRYVWKRMFFFIFLPTKNITEHSRETDISIFSNKTVPHPKKPKSTGPNVVPYSRFFSFKIKAWFRVVEKVKFEQQIEIAKYIYNIHILSLSVYSTQREQSLETVKTLEVYNFLLNILDMMFIFWTWKLWLKVNNFPCPLLPNPPPSNHLIIVKISLIVPISCLLWLFSREGGKGLFCPCRLKRDLLLYSAFSTKRMAETNTKVFCFPF